MPEKKKSHKQFLIAASLVVGCILLLFSLLLVFAGYFSRAFVRGIEYQVAETHTASNQTIEAAFAVTEDISAPQRHTTMYGIGANNQAQELFSITQNAQDGYHFSKEPRLQVFDDTVVAYFDGRQYDELTVWDTGTSLERRQIGYAPQIYVYSVPDGKVTPVELPKATSAVLDVFSHQNTLYFLCEVFHAVRNIPGIPGFSSSTYLYQLQEDFSLQGAEIGEGAVGQTPLLPKGTLVGDTYYYPTKDAIFALDLYTKTQKTVLDINLNCNEETELHYTNNEFVLASQRIDVHAQTPYKQVHSVHLQKYTPNFDVIQEAELAYALCDIYWAEDVAMLAVAPVDFSKVIYTPSEYIEIDLASLGYISVEKDSSRTYSVYTQEQWNNFY